MTKLRTSEQRYDVLSEIYKEINLATRKRETDPEWRENNLEYDLRTSDTLCEKVKNDVYAQNLYAALCNTTWQRRDVLTILKNDTWCCSWRYAGGVVADMREDGGYLDFYMNTNNTVELGTVTDEIRADLYELGWYQVD